MDKWLSLPMVHPLDVKQRVRKLAGHLIGRMPKCREVHGCTRTTMARLTRCYLKRRVKHPAATSQGKVNSKDYSV